jgi:hypothetical protein
MVLGESGLLLLLGGLIGASELGDARLLGALEPGEAGLLGGLIGALELGDTGLLVDDDEDVYLDKLQTRGVKKSVLYM